MLGGWQIWQDQALVLDVRVTLQVQKTVALGANPSDAQRKYASDLLMTPEDE